MLFRWLRNRRRQIFRFHDGRRVRAVDPIEAAMVLAEHPTYTPRHLQDAVDGNSEALEIVARACCAVFDVEPWSDSQRRGLTVAERLEIMLAFNRYMHHVKKNTASFATKRSSTAATSSGSNGRTTSGTSPSGATVSEASSDRPT